MAENTSTPLRLSAEELKNYFSNANIKWSLNKEQTIVSYSFEFKGFYKTMGFVNAVAWIAQQEMHHPDLEVSFNKCVVNYTTHDAGGLTEKDLRCLKKIEALNP